MGTSGTESCEERGLDSLTSTASTQLSLVRLAGVKQQTFTFRIDDYAKDGGPGQPDFDVVFTIILCVINNFIW